MSLHDTIRQARGGSYYSYTGLGAVVPPMTYSSEPQPAARNIQDRFTTLKSAHERNLPTFHQTAPIPEDDLRILEKIYHKEYEDCGRKRGALLRYIKHYRETEEPVNHSRQLIKHIEKVIRRSR